jgi:hypothetical protein
VRLDHVASGSRFVRGDARPAEAFLYDLSDERRSARVSGERFAMRSRPEADDHAPCAGPLAMLPGEL